MVPYPLAHGALQNFVGDFGQTALSSLQFLREVLRMLPISESRTDHNN